MPEQEKTDSYQSAADDKKDAAEPAKVLLRWTLTVGAIGFLILIVISVYHPYLTERVKFLVGSSLSLFVLLAVIVQAVIYRGQWKAMNEQRTVMSDQLKTMRDSLTQNQEAMEKSWLFANAQGIATAEQIIAMRDQGSAMKGQWEAMKSQNITLEKSIEIGQASSIYAQRAYVKATVEKIEEFQFHLRIENSGRTPANDVRVAYSFEMREKPPYDVGEDGVVAYDSEWVYTQRLGLIAPGGQQQLTTPKQTDPFKAQSNLWNKWKLNQVRYYVWGRIFYEDIFNKKRYTDFAFFQGRGHPDGYPCEHGNSAN